MSGRETDRDHARDVAERSEAESRAAQLPPPGTPGKIYTAGERAAALRPPVRSDRFRTDGVARTIREL